MHSAPKLRKLSSQFTASQHSGEKKDKIRVGKVEKVWAKWFPVPEVFHLLLVTSPSCCYRHKENPRKPVQGHSKISLLWRTEAQSEVFMLNYDSLSDSLVQSGKDILKSEMICVFLFSQQLKLKGSETSFTQCGDHSAISVTPRL